MKPSPSGSYTIAAAISAMKYASPIYVITTANTQISIRITYPIVLTVITYLEFSTMPSKDFVMVYL
ncbi:MAG: hypothetical protein RTV31_13360 [Candidatus Thorarchaeota archaeon]